MIKKIVITSLVIFALWFWATYKSFWGELLFPDKIRGEFISSTNVDDKLFIYTDISLYIYDDGGVEDDIAASFFTKTIGYFYDVKNKKILHKLVIKHDDIPTNVEVIYKNKKLYIIGIMSNRTIKNYLFLRVYDTETYNLIYDENKLNEDINKISSGIAKYNYDSSLKAYQITTKDGLDLTYHILFNKILKRNEKITESEDNLPPNNEFKYFILSQDIHRKKLCYLSSTKDKLSNSDYYSSNAIRNCEGNNLKILTEKVFLDGKFYFKDENHAFIIHKKEISDKKDYILSIIDNKGTIIFEADDKIIPKELIYYFDYSTEKLKIDFITSDLLMISVEKYGVIVLNIKTKEKIFEYLN